MCIYSYLLLVCGFGKLLSSPGFESELNDFFHKLVIWFSIKKYRFPTFIHNSNQLLNLTERYQHNKYLIHSSEYPSLKISNFRGYSGLSGSMQNFNLIYSDLSVSGPPTFSIFFTLETKGMGAGGFLCTEGGRSAEDLENLLMDIVHINLDQQKCEHNALYWEDNRKSWLSSILNYI
jgi:hypothetical protein